MEEKKPTIDETQDIEDVEELEKLDGLSEEEKVEVNKEVEKEVAASPVAEQTPAAEVEEVNAENVVFEEALAPSLDEEVLAKTIEDKRLAFFDYYKKQKRNSMIILVISLILVVAGLILISQFPNLFTVGLIVILLFFVGTFLYSRKTKKEMDVLVNEYISAFLLQVDSFALDANKFKDAKRNTKFRFSDDELKRTRFIKDVTSTGCRDVIEAYVNNKKVRIADAVLKVKSTDPKKKSDVAVFLGKLYLLEDESMKSELRTVVYLKGGKDSVGPTDINGLEDVKIDGLKEGYTVYSENPDVKKVINKKVIDLLNKFTINDLLIDVVISINQNGTYIGCSYADDIMVIPLLNPYTLKGTKQYQQDSGIVADIIKALK